MTLSVTSRAAAVGVSVKNVQLAPSSSNVPRKILVVGTYNTAITTVVDEVPVIVTSPEDAADKFGQGYMIHRLVKGVWAGSQGVECHVVPQDEASGAVAAAGKIVFAGTATESATLNLYIAGVRVPVVVASGDDAADVATAVAAAIEADDDLPVSAAVDGSVDEEVDITAKSKGPWGNFIDISFNWGFQEKDVAGITYTITDMASGAGVPDIADALDALGTGDDANEGWYTDGVHGYLQDSATFNAISTYNGTGNTANGCYDKLVGRPMRWLSGDTVAGSAGLAALIVIGNARRASDRTNGIVAVPGSPNHPAEIAAIAIGAMARINNDRAAQNYLGVVLPGVIPGVPADRWTSAYDSRDTAVKAGISPTSVVDGSSVQLQNVMTFYHPTAVPVDSNGYASMRNISIIQNLLFNTRLNFIQEKWQGVSIVADVKKVASSIDREKARDVSAVVDDLLALSVSWESKAWLYSAAYTVGLLKSGGLVTVRTGGNGFDVSLPVVLSGECGIIDTEIKFDTSLAVFLA